MSFGMISSKPRYHNNTKLCYMDTNSFIIHIQTKDVYKDIADDVEKRFDILKYGIEGSLQKGKNEKLTGLMKDKLVGKIMIQFLGLNR